MLPRLFCDAKFWIAAVLLAALVGIQAADFGALVDVPLVARKQSEAVTPATIDQAVEQGLKQYAYDAYRNVVDDSIFAVNLVKKEPVKIVEPEPEPPPPPPPKPQPKPFTANLEVTGIAITPTRKLVMIWDKVKKQTHVLREREKLYKWKVVSIDRQRVVLRHPLGGRYEFIVNEDTLVDFQK